MTPMLAALVAGTIALGSDLAARQQDLFVVIADESGRRGGFQPADHVLDVPNTTARVVVALMRKDVRLPDGKIVTGFLRWSRVSGPSS